MLRMLGSGHWGVSYLPHSMSSSVAWSQEPPAAVALSGWLPTWHSSEPRLSLLEQLPPQPLFTVALLGTQQGLNHEGCLPDSWGVRRRKPALQP